MSIDETQPALPGQTKRIPFKATRTASYGDGAGSRLTRKAVSVLPAESWTAASEAAPGIVASEHGAPEDDTEAASMGLELVSVSITVVGT